MSGGPLPCILWPIRFAATSYVLRCTQAGTTSNLAFPATGSLTVGRNYWLSGDGQADADGGVGGVGDLLAMLDTCLTAHPSSYTYTLALLTDTGKLTIESGSHGDAWSILWSSASTTLDEAIFGFTNVDTASSYAANGTLLPQGVWRPEMMVTFDSRDRQPTVSNVTASISGVQRVSRLALPKKIRDLRWNLLDQEKALEEYEAADEPSGSFEAMWNNSLSLGRALRYYPDETSRTTTSYSLYVPREVDFEAALQRDDRYLLRWKAELKLRRAD